jgi:sulfatase maturation enzyme AslB (radical SAM superfamily)
MNINLTTYCNLKCPYCFAKDLWRVAGNRISDREMSIGNLKTTIRIIKKSGEKIFRMFGGEPTLHSRFEQVYGLITRSGLKIELYSNGIIDGKKVEFLGRQKNLRGICLNVQEPDDYTAKQREKLRATLSVLGRSISLSFVIYRTDFDISFIRDLIKQFGLRKQVKISFATPCYEHENVSLDLADHRKVIRRFVSQSRQFKKDGICFYPDTCFLWCLFTKKQLDELYDNVRFKPANPCHPALEVVPNLSVFRCYGTASLSDPALKITRFKDAEAIYDYFARREMHLKEVGIFDKCFKCKLKNDTCGAGCLVLIVKSLARRQHANDRFIY